MHTKAMGLALAMMVAGQGCILEGSVYAVFVDERFAMCGRCFASIDGNLSLFAQDQGVAFSDVRLWEGEGK